jgi:hypothetical protein
MKRFSSSDFAEIIGHVAIVASLIFVGLQLMQSQEIAIASQYQDRASTAVEHFSSQMQNERAIAEKGAAILEDVRLGKASPALQDFIRNRSPESIGMWFYEQRVFFVMLDNFHYQYSNGFMADESWKAFRRQLRGELSKDSTAAYYQNYGLNPRASFEELCDEILRELETGK